jgi:FMN reductase (NADPH)
VNNTLEILGNRKSVRKFKDKKISADNVQSIIHSAMRAPTAGNQMLYSIIEVEDQKIKNKLVTSCDDQPFIATAPLVLLFLADYQRTYDFFISSGIESFSIQEKIEHRTPGIGDFMIAGCDALIAAQNSVIAAESLGIGSCYIGDIMENYEIHRDMFNLPEYTFSITLLCFGYPAGDYPNQKKTPRYPQEYIHFKNTYKRINKSGFEKMVQPIVNTYFKSGKYLGNSKNLGQHFYTKKFTADYTLEMNRSVQKALDRWLGNE